MNGSRIAPLIAGIGVTLMALAAAPVWAQQSRSSDDGRHPQRDRDVQLGIGAGLVDPDAETEIYYTAALRFRIDRFADDDVWEGDSYRGRLPADTGIRGYLEPEIGYWSSSAGGSDLSDLLVGLNLIGVVPTRGADFFLGVGFGVHFLDTQIDLAGTLPDIDESAEALGGNLQVGVDVKVADRLALFGAGRLDIVDADRNDRQTKVYGGLRFKF